MSSLLPLVGHYNPIGRYPCRALPILLSRRDEKEFVAFIKNGNPFLEEIPNDLEYVSHNESVQENLTTFDYRKQLLIANSESDVVAVHLSKLREGLLELLYDDDFAKGHPHFRLSLAKQVQSVFL